MASLGHVAVGLAAARWESARVRPLFASSAASMASYAALSLLPDADVLGLRLGVPYGAPWGHRGATHSLLVALALSLLIGALAAYFSRPFLRTFLLALLVTGSHGLLDAMTDGGRGAALVWPLSERRFFLSVRPLPVAPIGRHLWSRYGLEVLAFEALCFLPLLAYAIWPARNKSQ